MCLKFYKADFSVPETKRKEIVGLAKSKWVESYKACDTYHLLYKATVFQFGSVKKRNLYDKFYEHLDKKFNENWTWDAETKIKAHGLFPAIKSFEHIIALSLVFNGLEPLKLLVAKLKKCNQGIYKLYKNSPQRKSISLKVIYIK